jgi:hypothetical protein
MTTMFTEDYALQLMRDAVRQLLEEGYTPKEIIAEFKYILKEERDDLYEE